MFPSLQEKRLQRVVAWTSYMSRIQAQLKERQFLFGHSATCSYLAFVQKPGEGIQFDNISQSARARGEKSFSKRDVLKTTKFQKATRALPMLESLWSLLHSAGAKQSCSRVPRCQPHISCRAGPSSPTHSNSKAQTQALIQDEAPIHQPGTGAPRPVSTKNLSP